MKNKRFNLWLSAMLLTIMSITPMTVLAQETSSAIAGTILDSDGNPVVGATVVVNHVSTGASKTLTTNSKGNYQARGLRVGGPYTVTISGDGFGEVSDSDIYIKLGETKDLDATVSYDSVALDSIKVVGVSQSAIFNADNMGSGFEVDSETLENMPTISRSIRDFVKLDSRVNIRDFGDGISISGVNNRFNNFSIDGVATNDPFGLEQGGFPGLSQPFNIDTIEQLNVQLSPYDVTLSNFVGANINAVTKSGTNEFHGSFNLQYGNEDISRKSYKDIIDPNTGVPKTNPGNGETLQEVIPFTNENYSLTFGGPIIKDKLFFFLGYENSSKSSVGNDTNIPISALQEIADIAQNTYGFDVGALTAPTGVDQTKENLLVKFDWLINDYHRATFRYTTNEDNNPFFNNISRTRSSFGSHWYVNNFQNDSFAVNLYSDWTPNFTTEVRYSHSEFDKNPILNARLPQIEIEGVQSGVGTDDNPIFDGIVRIGTEVNRHANSLSTVDDAFYFEGNYFVGNHTVKFGFDVQKHDLNNVFRRNSLGTYTFLSPNDFANGIVAEYDVQTGIDPNDPYPAADWDWTGNGLFIQDNWMVNEKLTLVYGLRFDKPTVGNEPGYNPLFEETFGFANNNTIDEGVLQPRIGFNYDMSGEYQMQLRGGVGIFSGGTPNVWLSNPYTNPGLNVYVLNENDFDGNVPFSPDPDNQPLPEDFETGRQDVDVLEKGFKLPTVLKANLAFESQLPWFGLVSKAEYEYTKKRDDVFFEHLNLGESTGTLPDGRLSYREDPLDVTGGGERFFANDDFNNVYLLKNTGSGDLQRATFSLSKRTEHFFTQASYTRTDSNEVHGSGSSIAASNWEGRPAINPNDPNEVAPSTFQIENAFTFMINYNNNFFGDTITNVGLFWSSSDGEQYSYVYGNDVNGDGNRNDVDLFYVPLPDEYVLSNPDNQAAFETFLLDSGLAAYRGQIAPRNAFKAPRINQWDLKIKQELPSFGFARASLFLTIQNLGNLLDNDWGLVRTAFFRGETVADLEGFDDQGRYEIDWEEDSADGITFINQARSQWQAQIGLRFEW